MNDDQPPRPGVEPAAGSTTPDWAHSFGGVADAYDRGRPSYPAEAVTWLVGNDPATVLELGAGTGKLTRVLADLGHDVHATDPDTAMLALLEEHLPAVWTAVAGAEEIPLADASVDVVIAAQAFHWFDLDRALPEIARVLRPGGRICLLWNQRNEKIPWVRRLGAIIGTQEQLRKPAEALNVSELFGAVEDSEFTFWQTVDRRSIQDLVLSRSNVAVLDEAGRSAKLAEVLALYDEYGRGMDGMQLPYVTRCFRANLRDSAARDSVTGSTGAADDAPGSPDDPDGPEGAKGPEGPEGTERPDPSDGPDDEILLIDFR
jgi:SAM-dependent methyltransferase